MAYQDCYNLLLFQMFSEEPPAIHRLFQTTTIRPVEVCDPVLTPAAIRTWKLAYDVYARNPNRRMTMAEAFGTQSMRSLIIMIPDGPIPMDDTSFDSYITEKFMKTTNLFSEIKLAVSKTAMEKGAHLTVESLYQYFAGFCTSISPFSEEMTIRTRARTSTRRLYKPSTMESHKYL